MLECKIKVNGQSYPELKECIRTTLLVQGLYHPQLLYHGFPKDQWAVLRTAGTVTPESKYIHASTEDLLAVPDEQNTDLDHLRSACKLGGLAVYNRRHVEDICRGYFRFKSYVTSSASSALRALFELER